MRISLIFAKFVNSMTMMLIVGIWFTNMIIW